MLVDAPRRPRREDRGGTTTGRDAWPSTHTSPGDPRVDFKSRTYADVVVAAPAGRIDHASANELQHALAPLVDRPGTGAGGLVLDFTGVDYISSIGLRVLMDAARQVRGYGRAIAVASLQPVVGEIFAISRFHKVLDVHPSVRAALGCLSPPALAAFDADVADSSAP
jgi:anti-anti-sigma factor